MSKQLSIMWRRPAAYLSKAASGTKASGLRFLRLIRTASHEANLLAAGAILLLLLKVLWLNNYPAKLPGLYDLGILFEAVLASVVASYVFYLIVVHIKEQSDRDVLRPYVEKHSKRVIGDYMAQLQAISAASGIALDVKSPTEADLQAAFSVIPPHSNAPLLVSVQPQHYANWFQYFSHHEQRSKASIRKLLDQLPFLEASLVASITDIDDCHHFAQLTNMLNVPLRNTDLGFYASTFHGYCMRCLHLDSVNVELGFKSALV